MTITEIGAVSPWTGRDGRQMYEIKVTLSDGRSGSVNATKPDRWSVGDEVQVKSENQTNHGLKFQLEKPGGYQPNVAKAKDPDLDYKIEASWALKLAVQSNTAFDNLVSTSLQLIEKRNEVVRHLKSNKAQAGTTHEQF